MIWQPKEKVVKTSVPDPGAVDFWTSRIRMLVRGTDPDPTIS